MLIFLQDEISPWVAYFRNSAVIVGALIVCISWRSYRKVDICVHSSLPVIEKLDKQDGKLDKVLLMLSESKYSV